MIVKSTACWLAIPSHCADCWFFSKGHHNVHTHVAGNHMQQAKNAEVCADTAGQRLRWNYAGKARLAEVLLERALLVGQA